MKYLFMMVKKLHAYKGNKLYLLIASLVFISCMDGIGLFLLVPLLSVGGIIESSANILPIQISLPFFDGVSQTAQLLSILGVFVLLITGQAIMQQYINYQNTKINIEFTNYMRYETYRNLLQVNWSFYLRKRKTDLINSLTHELSRIHSGIFLFLQMTASIIFTCIQIALALWLSWQLTIFVIACGVLLAAYSKKFVRGAKKIGGETTKLSKLYLAGITDHVNGMKDIKSNNLEYSSLKWLKQYNQRLTSERLSMVKLKNRSQIIYKMISTVLIAVFIYISFTLFSFSAGQLLLIILIFSRLWPRFASFQSQLEQLSAQLPSFQSILELQAETNECLDGRIKFNSKHKAILSLKQGIAFKEISYSYSQNEAAALKEINFYIPANQMTAIVGRSGAGKSTTIDIIMGLLKPEKGQLIIDGKPITDNDITALRNSISYVPQDPFLFNASIKENMQIVKADASEEEIWQALEFAACTDIVRKFKDGLNTIIGDRGIKLSGGERQRIVLARAILRKPSILILDEATSSLDYENEMKIQKALEKLKGQITIITIAHRLSSIRQADQVIVLDQGTVVQSGTYAQLSEDSKGLFNKLLISQGHEAVYASQA